MGPESGVCRDVVAAREVAIELWEHVAKGLNDRSVTVAEVFPEPDDAVRVWDSMPSFDVAVSIKTEYHRDARHVWTTNDIADIDALGTTLPYCDIVVTDRAVASHARRTGLADRLDTTVLSSLRDLPPFL